MFQIPGLRPVSAAAAAAAAAVLLSACGGDSDEFNTLPSFVAGSVRITAYNGSTDDLLTAGLGKTGLSNATPPACATATAPTAAQLRCAAIYYNYRALVDTSAAGGFGRLYGPNIASDGSTITEQGQVAGIEAITYSDDGSGRQNVTLMVQVPTSFDKSNPCIVTATSSGSRGIYGGISTGEWGLKHGCAVAYTDKGTGAAPHDLATDTVPLVDGTRDNAAAAGGAAQFNAGLTASELSVFNGATPNRLAFKHSHSGRNPEKDWGQFTLQAVQFAFYVLNETRGDLGPEGRRLRTFRPGNTLVIASSVSNGGGAAIAAAEQDGEGLIDGVAVAEPAIEMPANPGVAVQRGGVPVATIGKTLYDFTSYANLYQSCASLAASVAGAPGQAYVVAPFAANRCTALRARGLLDADTPEALAEEALQKLRDYGWEPESSMLHASHAAFEVAPAVTVTFANALARARVSDNLCGYSFAATTSAGAVTLLPAAQLATMFATGNGVPPAAGVQLVNNFNPGGPLRDLFSVSASSGLQDFNLDGAICLRQLLGGTGTAAAALQSGLNETRRNGNLHGKPALIVHGRSDALLPVNHTSRPYAALNKQVEGSASKLSYIEVTNAQHFDGFIDNPALPGYDTRYVPLHLYLHRALDAVYAHLKSGTVLPPSQVVRTVPRGGTPGAAPQLVLSNVPSFAAAASAADAITVNGNTLVVPD